MPVPHAKPIERNEGPCNFVAGWHASGCLPTSDPEFFAEFDDAKRYVCNLIEQFAGDAMDESEAEDFAALQQDVNLESKPFCSREEWGCVFWVEPVEAHQKPFFSA